MYKKDDNTLLFDNDIEETRLFENMNQCSVLRMNINTSVLSFLWSSLENIYNTIKNRPDIELKMHDLHIVGDQYGQSLKEEVLWSLTTVRDFVNHRDSKSSKSLFDLKGGLDPSTDLDKLNLTKTKRAYLERQIRKNKRDSCINANH